jgi:broad specificity phosphatase PhoE
MMRTISTGYHTPNTKLRLPKRILLVRHGQSQGNVDEEAYHTIPDWLIPITDKGKEQAVEMGKTIKEIIKDEPLYIYYSPYLRTRQTMCAMMESLSENRIYGIREEPRITEQQFGNFQNKEMNNYKKEKDSFGRFYYRFPSGEAGLDVYNRVTSFIGSLFREWYSHTNDEEFSNTNVIIVTHGLSLRLFIMRWFHFTVHQFEKSINPSNGAIIIMERITKRSNCSRSIERETGVSKERGEEKGEGVAGSEDVNDYSDIMIKQQESSPLIAGDEQSEQGYSSHHMDTMEGRERDVGEREEEHERCRKPATVPNKTLTNSYDDYLLDVHPTMMSSYEQVEASQSQIPGLQNPHASLSVGGAYPLSPEIGFPSPSSNPPPPPLYSHQHPCPFSSSPSTVSASSASLSQHGANAANPNPNPGPSSSSYPLHNHHHHEHRRQNQHPKEFECFVLTKESQDLLQFHIPKKTKKVESSKYFQWSDYNEIYKIQSEIESDLASLPSCKEVEHSVTNRQKEEELQTKERFHVIENEDVSDSPFTTFKKQPSTSEGERGGSR